MVAETDVKYLDTPVFAPNPTNIKRITFTPFHDNLLVKNRLMNDQR